MNERNPSESVIRVAVAGASGKMGSEAVRALTADGRFLVSAVLTRRPSGQAFDCPEFQDPEDLLREMPPDVWLDLTDATSVVHNIDIAIRYGVRPVIGATGYGESDRLRWDEQLKELNIGGIAAPNFAVGAVLMMRFAREAARFFEGVEIIELHHDGKKDAPSGTAKRTAESLADLRGEQATSVPIHSVRLPGLVAHQEVLFGGQGEVLTIRHDSMNRSSFMPGVLIACREVMNVSGLVYGIDELLR